MLELKNIIKNYKIDHKPFEVLKRLSLSFDKNEFCAILGPSGCGKTTLLNLIGGLDRYDDGDLIIDGVSTKTFTDADWDNYRNKRIGFVFQSYNLIPHLSLLENVELALTLEGVNKTERRQKAKKALEIVGLGTMIKKKPNQLSGGQQQRVSIARALINNPEIVLADEPTGALDSESSKEIMELLKEVSKTRLVIMVTHNQDLAKSYATRIVTMEDGIIKTDTKRLEKLFKPEVKKEEPKEKPLEIIDEKNKKKKQRKDRTSMGFFTALAISLKNLLTKKGRTILTAVAGSFGIIGVALVLATSNGFEDYVYRVESQTASTMPVNIPAYSMTYEKTKTDYNPERHPDEKEIYPVINTMGKPVYKYNNFTPKYINYLNKLRDEDKLLNDYIITYGDDYSLNLTSNFVDGEIKPIKNVTTVQMAGMITSMTGLPMNMFHVLYGQEKYIMETYDVIDGTYPQNYDEAVIVLDHYNRLPPEVLVQLGFFDETATEEEMLAKPVSFDDLYQKKLKVFNNQDFYNKNDSITSVEDNYGNIIDVSSFKHGNYEKLFDDNSKGIDLKITGILRPKANSTFTLMSSGLCYTKELEEMLVSQNEKAEITTNLKNNFAFNKADAEGNKYTIKDFFDEFQKLMENAENGVLVSDINAVYDKYFTFYNYHNGQPYPSSKNDKAVTKYLNDCNSLGVDLISDEFKHKGITLDAMMNMILDIFQKVTLGQFDGVYEQLISLIASVNSYSTIQAIIVFPKDLTSKDKLLKALDEFNKINSIDEEDPLHASSKTEQVFYMDFAGAFTANMGQMIKIISIVLIIFASISLCVSCVMTGIITYVSVIERTKEIGILRALGARKKDVGRLFEAESCIIGALSGIFGCLMAWLICVPINLIINHIYPEFNIGNIASLDILHALVLCIISIALTFFSGLIPARIAAKKDPVNALRTE